MAHRRRSTIRRWVFNIAAVVSLLLFVFTITAWVISYHEHDMIVRLSNGPDAYRSVKIQSNQGTLDICFTAAPTATGGTVSQWKRHVDDPGSQPLLRDKSEPAGQAFWLLGNGYSGYTKSAPFYYSTHLFGVAYWLPAGLFAICPLLKWRSLRDARRRSSLGLCPHCGYDLRASPERCPECGQSRVSVA